MVLGVTLGGFAAYGFYAFASSVLPPCLWARLHDGRHHRRLSPAESQWALGIIAGGLRRRCSRQARRALVRAGSGHRRRHRAAILRVLAAAGRLEACRPRCSSIAGFFQYASLGPTFGVVQNVVDRRRRATATALLVHRLECIGARRRAACSRAGSPIGSRKPTSSQERVQPALAAARRPRVLRSAAREAAGSRNRQRRDQSRL